MLELKDLTLHYGQSQILHDVTMTAPKGEVTCVMGTNGVGQDKLAESHRRSASIFGWNSHC